MLTHLAIRDLVIVRELALDLPAGMTTLTGETGAGKSILIDALGLTLGDKANPGMIRQGRERAEVTSEFDLSDCPEAAAWLQAHDLDDEGLCLLRRVLVREGRSRAYINGTQAPQSALRELGALLLDIHGQHAHQSLLRPAEQRVLLDAYAGLQNQAAAVATDYQALQEAQKALSDLQQAAQDRGNRMDYLAFQIAELEPLAQAAAGLDEIEAEHARLAHADRLQSESGEIAMQLSEDEDDLSSRVARLARQLNELAELDRELAATAELLDSAAIQLDEAGQSLRSYRDELELDPYRLQQLDEQLGLLHDAARKHRVEVDELPQQLQRFREELRGLDDAEHNLHTLRQQIDLFRQRYLDAAVQLSSDRQKAAKKLARTVTASMQELGMQGGKFQVGCASDDSRISRHGIDQITFLVAANPGQQPAPLSEAASGGELSRISLAIQVATANCGKTPTLIFDEVDVGIGGAVAEIVGKLLRRLGQDRQVLCVTHLPQVAAQAHHHLQVRKHTTKGSTETSIQTLDPDKRVEEIARMLGGVQITSQTLAHAREMLPESG